MYITLWSYVNLDLTVSVYYIHNKIIHVYYNVGPYPQGIYTVYNRLVLYECVYLWMKFSIIWYSFIWCLEDIVKAFGLV